MDGGRLYGLERVRGIGPAGATAEAMDRQLRDLLAGRLWDQYSYVPPTPLVLAPGMRGSQTISIGASATFLALAATLTVTDGTATDTIVDPALTVRATTSSGSDLWSAATHARNLFGTGERPCYWPFYRMLEATSTLSFEWTSLETTDTVRIFPCLIGIRVYNEGWGT